jgi:hypothetical protein
MNLISMPGLIPALLMPIALKIPNNAPTSTGSEQVTVPTSLVDLHATTGMLQFAHLKKLNGDPSTKTTKEALNSVTSLNSNALQKILL